jgi:protein-S-isoprenylcysteine O-methyltransferase Ste14
MGILYGVAAYALFLATSVYAIGFVGNLFVPWTIDSPMTGSLARALVVDLALLGLFAAQHSVMARRGFKDWWTRYVPKPIERSTYVLVSSAALALLLWQWRPITRPIIWAVTDPLAVVALRAIFWLGWGVLLVSTFLINHFELFGLQQVFARMGKRPASEAEFRTPWLYRRVRHPIYLGFLVAFWAAPVMTAGHLLFAVAMTGYTLVGIWFEERDLVAQFGDRYRAYRQQAGMLLPRFGRARK